jgi:hypothetical protein
MKLHLDHSRPLVMAAGLCLLLLAGCGGGPAAVTSPSASSLSQAAPSTVSSSAPVGPRLLALLTTVRSQLREAYRRGRDGASVRLVVGDYGITPAPSTATSALERYVKSRPSSNLDLVNSLGALKGGLADAYDNGRGGGPFQSPPSISAALKRYLDAHPATAEYASRVTVFYCSGNLPATAARTFIDVLFWAEGAKMWAAGQMAPGLNDVMFYMTRPSADVPWQRVGIAPVG